MRDGSDGAALLAVVHYYCPEQMKLDGECGGTLASVGRPGRLIARQGPAASRCERASESLGGPASCLMGR